MYENPPYYEFVRITITGTMILMILAGAVKQWMLAPAYLVVILVRPGEVYPILGNIRFELLVVAWIGIVIVTHRVVGKNLSLDDRISKATFAFFGIALLSIVQAFDIKQSYDYAYSQMFPMLIFFITILSFTSRVKDIRLLIWVYLCVVAFLAWIPIFNYSHGIGSELIGVDVLRSKGQTSGVAGHVALANIMTQSLAFGYFIFLGTEGKIQKGILVGFFTIYLSACIASGSRGGFIGLLICGLIVIIRAKNRGITIGFVLGALILASFLIRGEYLNWMSTILDFGQTEYSASTRWDGLRHGIEMAARRPILGVGIGCYGVARSAWFGWNIWAHNLYGELIGELGLLGLISWSWIVYLCFKEIGNIKAFVRSRKYIDPFFGHLADACWAVLVLRIIIGMTTHSLMSHIWYLTAGLLVVASRILRKTYPEYHLSGFIAHKRV